MNGSLVLILHTHLPYVLHHGGWPHGSDWLCEAAAECYIPLLNVCRELVAEGITPAITLSMTPVVVEQLADPLFPDVFNSFLDNRIESAQSDIRYFEERPSEQSFVPVARFWEEWFTARKRDFNDVYRTDLVAALRELMQDGAIALQTSGATHGYFPLLGRDQSIHGQLGVAVDAHLKHFGAHPRGVWMPECAYRPAYSWTAPVQNDWTPQGWRKGVEQLISEHGLDYTVVDSHLTRGGRPLGIYAGRFEAIREGVEHGERYLPLDDSRSVHELYRISSTGDIIAGSPSIFTRDANTTLKVWSGIYGYPGDPCYLEFHKKHHNSGHRYWRVTDSQVDLGEKLPYDPDAVEARIRAQAAHFVDTVEGEMLDYRMRTGREGTLAAPFDTELFGHWWFEGPRFLAEVLRRLASGSSVRPRTAPDELDTKNPGMVIEIPEGSWGEGGSHEVWLNHQTEWTWPKIYEVEKRFLDLLGMKDPTDPRDLRMLRQLARENLLLQSSDWQFLITMGSAADYASKRLIEHYDTAMALADAITDLRHGHPTSLAFDEELVRLEVDDGIFPDLDLSNWRWQ